MSRIKILPENLANQIAAGEVIERPASVIKEFVENAIDAGAQHIAVQVEGDGSRLMRVVDDGCGMEQDDILLSLERHATSKLNSLEQLTAIQTLGFRGEAIPSIASVSKLTITSRPAESPLGSRAEVRFGTLLKVHEMGCPVGTVMEVRNLFGNLPARRKFLKSKQTELAHIDDILKNYALVSPERAISYQVQGKTVLDLPSGQGSLKHRIRQIFNRPENEALIPLQNDAAGDIIVQGYLIPPESGSSRGGGLRIFVNGRSVKDRLIRHAIHEGLHNFLLKGRQAVGALFLTVPAPLVDVNVHPTKQEVRFRQANVVHGVVVEAVRQGMLLYQESIRQDIFSLGQRGAPVEGDVPEKIPSQPAPLPEENATPRQAYSRQEAAHPLPLRQMRTAEPQQCSTRETVSSPFPAEHHTDQRKSKEATVEVSNSSHEQSIVADNQEESESPSLRYIGQVLDLYMVCEGDDGLVFVDQHAAQERLVFEEMLRQYEESALPSQTLLFPEIIDLTPHQVETLEQCEKQLERLGLQLEPFGGESYRVTGVPAPLAHLTAFEIVSATLARFSDEEESGGHFRIEAILAGMACKASIKAGRKLHVQEAEALLEQMRTAGIFSHCPHGRPVIKRFTGDEIKKWFLRT